MNTPILIYYCTWTLFLKPYQPVTMKTSVFILTFIFLRARCKFILNCRFLFSNCIYYYLTAVPTYTLLSSSKLYVNNKLPIDASSLIIANFSCIADSPTASLEWYINGQLLSAYEVFNISVRSTWPFTTNTSRIAYLSLTPINVKGLQSMNISCGPSYGGGLTTENITLIWLRGEFDRIHLACRVNFAANVTYM